MRELKESNMKPQSTFKLPGTWGSMIDPKILQKLIDAGSKNGFKHVPREDIENGSVYLTWLKGPLYMLPDGQLYKASRKDRFSPPPWMAQKITDDITSILPKFDNIKGTTEGVRREVARKIPGFLERINDLSSRYGIDRNLLLHRIKKEGFFDELARNYNKSTSVADQKSYWNSIPKMEIDGFYTLGLDHAGSELESGTIKPLKKVTYRTIDATNEHGQPVKSIAAPYEDALEIKAASLKHRQDIMRRKGAVGEDLNTWTNAAYNLGPYHKDLRDSTWIRENYTVPNYDHYYK